MKWRWFFVSGRKGWRWSFLFLCTAVPACLPRREPRRRHTGSKFSVPVMRRDWITDCNLPSSSRWRRHIHCFDVVSTTSQFIAKFLVLFLIYRFFFLTTHNEGPFWRLLSNFIWGEILQWTSLRQKNMLAQAASRQIHRKPQARRNPLGKIY